MRSWIHMGANGFNIEVGQCSAFKRLLSGRDFYSATSAGPEHRVWFLWTALICLFSGQVELFSMYIMLYTLVQSLSWLISNYGTWHNIKAEILPYRRAEHMIFAPPSPNTTTTTFRRLKILCKGLKSLSFDLKCREFYVVVSYFIFRNFFSRKILVSSISVH